MNKGLYREDRFLLHFFFFFFFSSPRFELPVKDESSEKKAMNIVCHYCNQPGHKASSCPSNPHKENYKVGLKIPYRNGSFEVFQFPNQSFIHQGSVVQGKDKAIQWITRYQVHKC